MKRSDDTGASSIACVVRRGAAIVAPAMTSIAIAASFSSISAVCVLLPLRTPRQLMSVSASNVMTASSQSGIAMPVRLTTYFANVAATAAIPPLCTISSSAHPYRKATDG